MKKYTTYRCDKCKRTLDVENNTTHAPISKCVITQGCSGTLRPLTEKNVRNILASRAPGLTDWVQRGTAVQQIQALQNVQPIPIACDAQNSLTLAVKGVDAPQVVTTFSIAKTVDNSYIEYYYDLLPPIAVVSGADSSSLRKVLRFTPDANIAVYINGVEKGEGVDWTRGTNSIKLNTTLSEKATIRVVVFSDSPLETIELLFTRNALSANASSCWGNVNSVLINGHNYFLYTCTSVDASIPINSRLKAVAIDSNSIPLSDACLLFGFSPWLSVDRIRGHVVALDGEGVDQINYQTTDLGKEITASFYAVVDVYPPINISRDTLFTTESVPTSKDTADSTLPQNKFVIGIF